MVNFLTTKEKIGKRYGEGGNEKKEVDMYNS